MPMAGRQIAEAIGQSFEDNVNKLLKKLLDSKEIKCIELNRHKAIKYFGSKRKLRLYYVSTLDKRDLIKAKSTLPYL